MEIHFQTTDHVVAVEIVAEQHIGTKLCSYNTFEDISHLLIIRKIANLISKLNFYKLIPYPMDNSLSGRRRPARQTSEKDVLCLHQQVGPEYQCTRQVACRTSFLSRQSDVIASFFVV